MVPQMFPLAVALTNLLLYSLVSTLAIHSFVCPPPFTLGVGTEQAQIKCRVSNLAQHAAS